MSLPAKNKNSKPTQRPPVDAEPSEIGHAAGPPGSAPPSVNPEPLLPHERDESLGGVDEETRPVIEQAKKDLDAGLVDTDMRATPGLDAEQRDRLVPAAKRR